MADFMLLLRDDPADFGDVSPEEIQQIIGRYEAWRQGLSDSGQLIDGNKLVDEEGRLLRREGGQLRTLDGPFAETKEIVGGYFAIRAESYDEAVKIAESCPHLDFGSVEVRRIDHDH